MAREDAQKLRRWDEQQGVSPRRFLQRAGDGQCLGQFHAGEKALVLTGCGDAGDDVVFARPQGDVASGSDRGDG